MSNIETLSAEQNGQLQRALEYEDRAAESPATATPIQAGPIIDEASSPTIYSGKMKAKS